MRRARSNVTGSVVALVAGGAVIAGVLWSPSGPPSATPLAAPTATARVTRGALVDTKSVSGTLGYGELSALRPTLADASAMVTWLAPVGASVARGEPLYALDGRPAILFYGPVPQYRTLRFDPAAPAPVWVELEQAQTALDTAELMLQLETERLTDAEARIAELGARLVDALSGAPTTPEFMQLSGAVSTARAQVDRQRQLSAAELAPSVEIADAEGELAVARAAFDDAIRTLHRDVSAARLDAGTTRVALAEVKLKLDVLQVDHRALIALALHNADVAQIAENLAALGYRGTLAEQVRAWQNATGFPVTGIVGPSQLVFAEGPVHIADHNASIGETLLESSPDRGSILDYSSTDKLVSVPLSVGDQALATVGRAVTVTLPDDKVVRGTIVEVGSIVTEGNIEVTIAIADQPALGTLEVASVDVEFVSDRRDDVLSVPITALLARPEGGFAVELVTDRGSAVVSVDTGLFAAGRVEVSGERIAEGMQVGVPG